MRIASMILALVALAPLAAAQDATDVGSEITIELISGEKLTGTLAELALGEIILDHPLLGRLVIPRHLIKPSAPAEEEAIELESPWSGSIDAALSGSRGNSDSDTFRAAVDVTRDTEETFDTYRATYRQVRDNGDRTEDRFFGKARREWKSADSEWDPFVQATLEFDEFTDYNSRLSLAAGASRTLVEEEDRTFKVRVGAGASKENGGVDDSWTPEALLGADYNQDISEHQRVKASVDVFPSLEDLGEYRSEASAHYEIDLGAEAEDSTPWFLKLGIEHFYDSEPGPARPWDYNYYVGLGKKF